MIELRIDGDPKPWKRPGFRRCRDTILTYDQQSQEKKIDRRQLLSQFHEPNPIESPIKAHITFRMKVIVCIEV
jgi:hypothetical protein